MLLAEVTDMLQKEIARKRSNDDSSSSINSRVKRRKQLATQYLSTPQELVGKDIVHRFTNESTEAEELWDGKITEYRPANNMHIIVYTGDTEQYEYDLTVDITNGDLWVLL